MRQPLLYILLLLSVAGVAGCNPAARFSVVDVETPTLDGFTSVHGRATVESRSRKDLVVESALLTVRYKDNELGAVRLMLPIEVPAESTNRIRYDLALDGVSLASLQAMQTRLMTNPGAFTLDAKVYVRWGGLRKKIAINGMALTRVMDIIYNFAP